MKDKLDILVVEDTKTNQDSAKELLRRHSLRIAETYSQAISMMEERSPQVLLTDMNFPLGKGETNDTYSPRPLGFSLALYASRPHIAVPKIAIYTDTNHHADAVSATFDNMYSLERTQDEPATELALLERFDTDFGLMSQKKYHGGRPVFSINNSKLVIFDIRDLPEYFMLEDGQKGTQRELYDRGVNVDHKDARKNWKAVLDAIQGM